MVTLRGFPAYLVILGLQLPPVRHVTALSAVELHRNVVVAAWASTSIVHLGIHCVGPLLQIRLRYLCTVTLLGVLQKTNSNQDASWSPTGKQVARRENTENISCLGCRNVKFVVE